VYIKREASVSRTRDLLERALAHETRPEHVEWIQQFEAMRMGPIP